MDGIRLVVFRESKDCRIALTLKPDEKIRKKLADQNNFGENS